MAALNIISTLIMLVLDKRKEISILKSMGASRVGVMGIFMLTGTVIGLSGLALGMGLGYGACHLLIAFGWPLDPEVYLIDKLPLEINWLDYVMTAVVTLVICTLFTIVPSWHASLYRPVDGLKHE
jgi:lipoprotein-releasing system permease protein